MSWDIYGNTLSRGHCEVHPHVHEEYPCSVCVAEQQQHVRREQEHYEEQQREHEYDMMKERIEELESTIRVKDGSSLLEVIAERDRYREALLLVASTGDWQRTQDIADEALEGE